MNRCISYIILLSIIFVLSSCILWNPSWILGDDFQILQKILANRPLLSWSGIGRFWPFGLVDYSVLLLCPHGNTITAHLLYNILVMSISILILFKFLNKLNSNNYFVSIICIVILCSNSSFLKIHSCCIFPERFIFFLLTIFMISCKKGKDNQSITYYSIALLCAIFATYSKEPICGIFIIFSFMNLYLEKNTIKDRIFHYSLILNFVIYILIYYCITFQTKYSDKLYSEIVLGNIDVIGLFLDNLILVIIIVLFFIRIVLLLRKSEVLFESNVFSDGLLFAACGYLFVFAFVLKVNSNHYFFPTIILSLPSISYLIVYLLKRYRHFFVYIMILLFLIYELCFSVPMVISTLKDKEISKKIINFISIKHLNGTKIIWIVDDWLLQRDPLYNFHRWKINAMQTFIQYFLNKPSYHDLYNNQNEVHYLFDINNLDKSIINYTNNIESITEKDIIIYDMTTYYGKINHSIIKKLAYLDFYLYSCVCGLDIYLYKKLKKISLPFYEKFIKKTDDKNSKHNLRTFGFHHSDNFIGIFSGEHESIIKLKLNTENIKISFDVLSILQNKTLSISINNMKPYILKMSFGEERMITLSVPKKYIKNETITITFKILHFTPENYLFKKNKSTGFIIKSIYITKY